MTRFWIEFLNKFSGALASSAYDPIDVISIYTLRICIEILFQELKQCLNIENFHSKSLNGVLFELFCALIGYVLVEWFRQCHSEGWHGACDPANPDLLEQDN
jgi:hypothetical protein